jgi:transposase-like protein
MEEVLRQLGISDATYYKWRKQYGGLRIDQANSGVTRAARRQDTVHRTGESMGKRIHRVA